MDIGLVETERMWGERLASWHWETWRAMGSDPAVMATLGGVWSEETARTKLDWNIRQWEENGHGLWLFFLKDKGEFVGRCGIRRMTVNGALESELGYTVVPRLWGRGLAPEMGAKALDVAFGAFKYPSIVAFTLTTNKRSERVMQKLGFAFEARIEHSGQPHVLYRLKNPEQ